MNEKSCLSVCGTTLLSPKIGLELGRKIGCKGCIIEPRKEPIFESSIGAIALNADYALDTKIGATA